MKEKSVAGPHFYARSTSSEGSGEAFTSLATTAGPWSERAQHGGPPSALLARAIEALPEAADAVVGRIGIDLLGPVPVAALHVEARVLRPGRSVRLAEAALTDVGGGRVVATARAWLLPRVDGGPGEISGALPHTPEDGRIGRRPPGWLGGYLDAVEWRWISGRLDDPGPGVAWMRPPALLADEPTSPLQRLMMCVDSASGVGASLDVRQWAFLNTDLTVHVLRPLEGEWVCLEAQTTLGPGSVGIATSTVHDRLGLVARSSQTLLVSRR